MFSDQLLFVDDFRYKSLKSWTIDKNQLDPAIQFIGFHRFPLSIDKNHLIATDFYLLTTPSLIKLNWFKKEGLY